MLNDPLLPPYQLMHLTLKNRRMITSQDPACPEDRMSKKRREQLSALPHWRYRGRAQQSAMR